MKFDTHFYLEGLVRYLRWSFENLILQTYSTHRPQFPTERNRGQPKQGLPSWTVPSGAKGRAVDNDHREEKRNRICMEVLRSF